MKPQLADPECVGFSQRVFRLFEGLMAKITK